MTDTHNQPRFKVAFGNPQGLFGNGIQANARRRPGVGNREDHTGRRDWEPYTDTATILSII
jgi:hypothetical protein